MLLLVFLFCVTSYYNVVTCSSLPSPYEYDCDADGWFRLHLVPADFDEARLRCHYEGGVLASPLNASLAAAMKRLMSKEGLSTIYTGIHSKFSPGDFVSVEGVPLYAMGLSWSKDEPGDEGEDCIVINQAGKMADYGCKSRFPYICYNKAPQHQELTVCGTQDSGYEYFKVTGSCYKVLTVGRTWSRAFMTCLAEGGHLAIVNSEEEAQVIKELLQRYPPEKMTADYKHVASIGYVDWQDTGSWWTIHGQELSEAGYALWENGKRDSSAQLCGGINRTGKLNDIWCRNNTFPAICERPPTIIKANDAISNFYPIQQSQQ